MSMCPKCKENIETLLEKCLVNKVWEFDGADYSDIDTYNVEHVNTFDQQASGGSFYCPECDEELFTSESDAVAFLMRGVVAGVKESPKFTFIRANAMRTVLSMFDQNAFKHPGVMLNENLPGVAYAVEIGWIVRNGAFYHLTTDGIVIGSGLASEREDWFFEMADRVAR